MLCLNLALPRLLTSSVVADFVYTIFSQFLFVLAVVKYSEKSEVVYEFSCGLTSLKLFPGGTAVIGLFKAFLTGFCLSWFASILPLLVVLLFLNRNPP